MPLSRNKDTAEDHSIYRLRIMAALIIVELLVLGIFRFWPVAAESEQKSVDFDNKEDILAFREVPITNQTDRPAAPPKPQSPIPVPEDEIIKEEILDIDMLQTSEFSDSLPVEDFRQSGNSDELVINPTEPAIARHIVEPNTPRELQQEDLKVQVWVNMVVDPDGKVEEVYVDEIKVQRGKEEEMKAVKEIGYNLVEISLRAAEQWRFRPARDNGRPVRSQSTQVFSYGF